MSGEPKTLTPEPMTLEEAMREVHFVRLDELRERHGNLADVQVAVVEDGWWVFLNDDGKWNHIEEFGIGEWEAAFSYALGRKVAARDDAAHLEAELSKWWSAYVEVAGFLGMVSTDDTGRIGAVAGMEEVLAELEQREKDAAELRAACEAAKSALTALDRVQMYGSADMVRDRAKRALDLIDAALAATEGES